MSRESDRASGDRGLYADRRDNLQFDKRAGSWFTEEKKMSNRDANGDSNGADAQLTPIHVTAVLVASERAMSNALDALGFSEEDDRIVEQDGRFGFVTCSHEHNCDDMFALIAELSSSGETWEIGFQADLAPDRLLSHTLNRHRLIVAHEQQVVPHFGDGAGSKGPELPVQDLDTSQGKNEFSPRIARRN